MKKRVIACVLIMLFASILAYSRTGVFKIDEKYPRWFSLNGKRTYLIASGMGSVPQGKLLDELTAAGVNAYRLHIMLNYDRGCPYNYRKGMTVDNNWGGFDSAYFSQLKRTAKLLKGKNSVLFIVVGGTPMRKERHGTWQTHLWNSANGGPIPHNEHGVRGFYKLGKNGVLYNLSYQKSWSWQKKAQFRFEQLLAKIIQELPEARYSVGLILMWEVYSGYNPKWTLHMVKFLQSLTESMPIGIGTYRRDQLDYINSRSRRPIFGIFEGGTLDGWIEKESISGKYPIVPVGSHCRQEGRFSGLNPENRCKFFLPGQELLNSQAAIDGFIECFKAGINTSFPFPSWWHGIDVYVKKVCKGKFPIEKYNSGMVKNDLLKFLEKFSKRIRKVNLKKVPGKRMNKKVNKWRKKNGY